MDAISLITAFTVIGIFMLIFILPTLNAKKNHKMMHAKLNGMILGQGAAVTNSVILGDAIVGVDDKKTTVFFYKKVQDIESSKSVLLSEMKSCKILTQTKSLKSQNENFNQFEKIGLQFANKDKSKSDIFLEFYNQEDNSHLNFDLKTLEVWGTMLNTSLK